LDKDFRSTKEDRIVDYKKSKRKGIAEKEEKGLHNIYPA